MSGSKTIIADEDRLPNVHPGDVLRHDFLIGSEIKEGEVAGGTGIAAKRLREILDGQRPIDADMDIRLARYLGMHEGFFLALQQDFDLEEVRRSHGAELDRIVRRAA